MPHKPNRNSWDDDDAEERDWEEHEYDEDELDDEADYGDEDDTEVDTRLCPHCRAEVYEEAEQCPECGEYVTSAAGPFAGKSVWIVVTALILLGAFLLFAIR